MNNKNKFFYTLLFLGVGSFVGSFVGVVAFPRVIAIAISVGLITGSLVRISTSKK